MSGDVQPRKRKDKKKKKEIIEETVTQHPAAVDAAPQPNDEINIHVYKETTTGGGICAKCVFFILMIGIAGLIGFLITEHRGQTDLDIAKSESRFAQFFEGWVDKSRDEHDEEHSDEVSYEEENVSEEKQTFDEHELSDENEASKEHEESEEQEVSEVSEVSEEHEISEEDEISEEHEISKERETSEEQDDDEQDNETSDQEVEEEHDSDDEEEIDADDVEEDEIDAEEDIDAEDEEIETKNAHEDVDESDEIETDNQNEIETDDESHEKSAGKQDEKEDQQETPELTTSAVAVKVGVGVALFVVAYVVLVRKWKSDISDKSEKKEEIPDLGRRNTIVPPPTLEEIEQDIENIEEEYSEDEELEESEEESKPHLPAAKKNYQELRSSYSRSLTPESEPEVQPKSQEYEDDEEYDEEDDREITDEDEDIDEELMKKLEEKYGKLNREKHYDEEEDDDNEEQFDSWKRVKVLPDNGAESESDDENVPKKRSGAQSTYEYGNITNSYDYNIKDDLDNAQKHLSGNVPLALGLFDKILEKHPHSPRGLYGKAQALDLLAEKKRSNHLLQESMTFYSIVLQQQDVPDSLFITAGERSINRMRFVGHYGKAINIHKMLINKFPNDVQFRNQLAVTYLTTNRIAEARLLLLETLQKWPKDGFALVHYGFILKTTDNNLNEAINYFKKGINTKESGVIDGRFYFHLGDALARLGRPEEAMKVYEDGVENKVFLSKYQRSLYNVDRLTGRPWWGQEQTPYKELYDKLEKNWKEIRNEGLAILSKKGYFKDESENLRDKGDWKQFELFARGIKHIENCKKCPITCNIIDSTPDVRSCKRGQVKFSVMHPDTHIWPHCGPTNCRLRVHLGLKVPSNTFIRVAEETRSWDNGKIIIFDDSFEHEVWHNGTEFRLVLIVDVWHPELTQKEKQTLSAI